MKWSRLPKGEEEETEILHLPRNSWPSFHKFVLILIPQSAVHVLY